MRTLLTSTLHNLIHVSLAVAVLATVCMVRPVFADESSGDDSGDDDTDVAMMVQVRTLA